ncbi:MAG TPA: hypothetical protein PKD28_00800 [Candidatus Saccharibacteria bacterium]|nr:hypothetical protein [Candidatus Saccharibacteria bacterium]
MTRTNITEQIWYDPEVKHYIMLDVTEQIPEQTMQVFDGTELFPKDEYHVSLVAAGKLSEDPATVAGIVDDVRSFLHDNPEAVAFQGLGDERYVCRDGDEMTLIAPARIVALDGLRGVVRRRIPEYEPAFSHVTLLKSASSPYGIGINSDSDLAAYCQKVEEKGE